MIDKTEAQPEALRLEMHQECAEFAASLRSAANTVQLEGKKVPLSFLRAADLFERAAAELRRLHAEIQQLKAQQNELREEQRLCMLEASGLANSMFKKHFSHERHYASGEVVWGLCDSVRGVISQIDNMASGLVRPEAQLSARQAAPDGWRLVPVEATRSMMAAAVISEEGNAVYKNLEARYLEQMEREHGDAYAAMLSAAPPPPEREPPCESSRGQSH